MGNILGATGIGVIGLVLIILGAFFIVILISLPFNVFRIKEILQNIDENLVKSNQMAVHNNKRLKELIELNKHAEDIQEAEPSD